MKLSERQLLRHAGKVSAEQAQEKASQEFEKYKKDRDKNYVSDFDREVKKLLERKKNKK